MIVSIIGALALLWFVKSHDSRPAEEDVPERGSLAHFGYCFLTQRCWDFYRGLWVLNLVANVIDAFQAWDSSYLPGTAGIVLHLVMYWPIAALLTCIEV